MKTPTSTETVREPHKQTSVRKKIWTTLALLGILAFGGDQIHAQTTSTSDRQVHGSIRIDSKAVSTTTGGILSDHPSATACISASKGRLRALLRRRNDLSGSKTVANHTLGMLAYTLEKQGRYVSPEVGGFVFDHIDPLAFTAVSAGHRGKDWSAEMHMEVDKFIPSEKAEVWMRITGEKNLGDGWEAAASTWIKWIWEETQTFPFMLQLKKKIGKSLKATTGITVSDIAIPTTPSGRVGLSCEF